MIASIITVGSKGRTHGEARAELSLNPKHRYAARVTGAGAHRRPQSTLLAGEGHFGKYPRMPGNRPMAPEFFDQSHCL